MSKLRQIRLKLRNLFLRLPKNVECNVCGWSGRHLASDDWHPHSVCWKCRSKVRHRLMIESLTRIDGLTYKDLIDGKRTSRFGWMTEDGPPVKELAEAKLAEMQRRSAGR